MVAIIMASNQTAPRVEVTAEAPIEEETLPASEPPMAQGPIAATTAVFTDIEIPTWNLGERIPIAPKAWDADTPHADVGTAEDNVDIINLDESEITPTVPEDVRKSPKEKRNKKRRRSAQRETDGRLVIRLKTAGSTRPADATDDNGRPAERLKFLRQLYIAQRKAQFWPPGWQMCKNHQNPYWVRMVQPTDGMEPIVETVDAPTPMIGDHTLEEESAQVHTDTEQETVQVSAPSTPMSTAATANVAGEKPAKPTVREQATEVMMLLEMAMRNVCAWSEWIEAQTSATAERDVIIWKRRLENCEASLKRKNAALSEAEKGQVELRKALEAKDTELAKVRVELEIECRKRTDVTKLREELREAQADVKALRRRNGVLRNDVDIARQGERRMSDAFEMLNAEMKNSKDTWKCIQTRLVTGVERAHKDNGKLTQALANRNTETKKLAQERDARVGHHRQAQEELGLLRMELSVAVKDLKKARANQDAQQWEIDRLMGELGKKSDMTQANLKRIVKNSENRRMLLFRSRQLRLCRDGPNKWRNYKYWGQIRLIGIFVDPDSRNWIKRIAKQSRRTYQRISYVLPSFTVRRLRSCYGNMTSLFGGCKRRWRP
jgi:hypothetical protein